MKGIEPVIACSHAVAPGQDKTRAPICRDRSMSLLPVLLLVLGMRQWRTEADCDHHSEKKQREPIPPQPSLCFPYEFRAHGILLHQTSRAESMRADLISPLGVRTSV